MNVSNYHIEKQDLVLAIGTATTAAVLSLIGLQVETTIARIGVAIFFWAFMFLFIVAISVDKISERPRR